MHVIRPRLNRRSYCIALISLFAALLLFVNGTALLEQHLPDAGSVFESGDTMIIALAVCFVAGYAMALLGFLVSYVSLVKARSNDVTDRYAPIVTLLALFPFGALLLALFPGQKDSNRFGHPPAHGFHIF